MSAQLKPLSLDIRRLHPTSDGPLYREVYRWLLAAPPWRKEVEAVFSDWSPVGYHQAIRSEGRVDIGVFSNGNLIAVVVLTIQAKDVYEVHLDARPHADAAVIIAAGRLIRDQLFSLYNAQSVFAWTPKWHRGVIKILKAIGFHEDHVTMLHGTCRGRVIEWIRLSLGAGDGQ